jgi:predicted transcriptional regulator
MTATTVRLPEDLDERLSAYCATTGAVKNRVMALALRSYLDGEPVCREEELREPEASPFAGERLGALRLVLSLADLGLDADEIAETTGLDRERIVATLGARAS